jgi:hypothetical protein
MSLGVADSLRMWGEQNAGPGGQWYSRTTLISGANAPRKPVRLPNRSRYPLLGANWSKSRQPMRGLRIVPSAPHPNGHAHQVRKVNEAARANALALASPSRNIDDSYHAIGSCGVLPSA